MSVAADVLKQMVEQQNSFFEQSTREVIETARRHTKLVGDPFVTSNEALDELDEALKKPEEPKP